MEWLIETLRQLTDLEVSILDLIDILVVAALIYLFLVLLRGTRAMQMLGGIAFIALLYAVATLADLFTLSTILRQLLFYLPFAIIVLFQQEIRRVLAAFGSTTWMRFAAPSEGHVLINELTLAAKTLAARRTGALIAIERSDALGTWIDTGIQLDARFSYDLLLNLFIDGTPLHDGVAIVRGERVAAAACFVPLTTTKVSSELGSRHRAAIGLSEETDALVVVVSEETGTISLAVQGQLLRPLDETTLREALVAELNPSSMRDGE